MNETLERLLEECPRPDGFSKFSRQSHACGFYFHVLTPWGLVCDEWNTTTAKFMITPRQFTFMRAKKVAP